MVNQDVEAFATAHTRKAATFFADGTYSIPNLQRDFAWSTPESDQLWADLQKHVETSDPFYFLGNIIYYTEGGTRKVVDGQQRLTTITILNCALRDVLLEAIAEEQVDENQELDLRDRTIRLRKMLSMIDHSVEDVASDGEYRLTLKGKDRERLAWVQKRPNERDDGPRPFGQGPPRMYRVYDGYVSAAKTLMGRPDGLNQTCEILLASLEKVVFTTTKVDSLLTAYTVFSTINKRGKDLTLADIVKAKVLEQWQRATGEEPEQGIIQMMLSFDDLDYDELPRFMRRYWIMKTGEKKSPRNTYDEMMESIEACQTRARLRTWVKDMADAMQDYVALMNIIETGGDLPWHMRLSVFSLSKFQQHLPLALAMIRNKCSDEVIEQTIDEIERIYLNHYVVLGRSPSEVAYMFPAAAKAASDVDDIAQFLREEYLKLADGLEFDMDSWREYFSTRNMVHNAAHFVLRRVELARWPNTQEIQVQLGNPRELQLEHVLPQSPNQSAWPSKWQDEEVLGEHLDRIGNLTLLQDKLNSSVKNGAFDMKKEDAYAASAIKITRDLLDYGDWDENMISKRSKQLAEEIVGLWL